MLTPPPSPARAVPSPQLIASDVSTAMTREDMVLILQSKLRQLGMLFCVVAMVLAMLVASSFMFIRAIKEYRNQDPLRRATMIKRRRKMLERQMEDGARTYLSPKQHVDRFRGDAMHPGDNATAFSDEGLAQEIDDYFTGGANDAGMVATPRTIASHDARVAQVTAEAAVPVSAAIQPAVGSASQPQAQADAATHTQMRSPKRYHVTPVTSVTRVHTSSRSLDDLTVEDMSPLKQAAGRQPAAVPAASVQAVAARTAAQQSQAGAARAAKPPLIRDASGNMVDPMQTRRHQLQRASARKATAAQQRASPAGMKAQRRPGVDRGPPPLTKATAKGPTRGAVSSRTLRPKAAATATARRTRRLSLSRSRSRSPRRPVGVRPGGGAGANAGARAGAGVRVGAGARAGARVGAGAGASVAATTSAAAAFGGPAMPPTKPAPTKSKPKAKTKAKAGRRSPRLSGPGGPGR